MGKKKIIILGGGGHAKVLVGTILRLPDYEIIGFLDDDEQKTELLGIQRVGSLFPAQKELETKLLVLGLGHIGNSTVRKKVIAAYENAGYTFETVIAPSAIISSGAYIGKGVFIADGVVVQPDVKIGDYAIINTQASIDHDCVIGDNVHVAPGTTLSGAVTVGDNTLLGTGSSVMQEIEITNDCIIGAGAVVTKNCIESGTYVGVPATLRKK